MEVIVILINISYATKVPLGLAIGTVLMRASFIMAHGDTFRVLQIFQYNLYSESQKNCIV